MIKKILFIIPLFFIAACHKNVSSEVVVYNNDFETGDLSNITTGVIGQFNNSAVLGQYNNGGFILKLNNLPKHDLITVSFDLYIHDSWDGNKTAPDGPDIWEMLINGSPLINTSFSNSDCSPGNFCSPQSYPADYPSNYNNPKTGAYRTDLPGACHLITSPHGTTMYKIVKTFKNSDKTMVLQCLDKLIQTNTDSPKCDESWSVDNINVKAITL
ncbi:hypothetical protein [Mucilaginibacter xinganensis]|uniref:Lipoprotein n=1 Tax=Mucilaginibacter xinganensis TaxID=1234841 RepID=A0A223NVK3_9SPHI|nr:hypothetical protein [Mucilaginibacter xinganensis]ASU33658.1 hypothetical protein MuYL_1762 [Mucilaginibacter xinganensis]